VNSPKLSRPNVRGKAKGCPAAVAQPLSTHGVKCMFLWLDLYIPHRAQQKILRPKWLWPDCQSHFFLPKGGPKLNICPRPTDLDQHIPNIKNSPLVVAGTREDLIKIHCFLAGNSTLGTSRHKLSMQGCLNISNQGSYTLNCTFLHWGIGDGWPNSKFS